VVGSRFPFRDPPRRPDDSAAGSRPEPASGNRAEQPPPGNRLDAPPGNRIDRARDQSQRRPPRPERPRGEDAPEAAPVPPAARAAPDLAAVAAEVEALVRLLTATDVTELQVEAGTTKIVIRRGAGGEPAAPSAVLITPAVAPAPPPAPAPAAPAPAAAHLPPAPGHGNPAAPALAPGEHLITSPMVGTFYAAPSPQEAPYVVEGAEVSVGQTVGIVEAMKMMNPIEAEISGRVARVLVRDAQGVEYGQPLMVIAES
jgi:acetyl-CoA carboxylase biotin carboxyl carrier protein